MPQCALDNTTGRRGLVAGAHPVAPFGVGEVVAPQPGRGLPHERRDQRPAAQGVHEAGAVGMGDDGLDRPRVRGSPSGPAPTGVAWVSTTLPAPSPSTMRMTTVRGSGLVNSATTGTPKRPMWNVTGTRNRSGSSGRSASAGGAASTSSCANEYGWYQAPCHGSSRLAMMSLGSHVPTSRVTACNRGSSGRAGRIGCVGRAARRRRGPAAPRPARRRRTPGRASSRTRGRPSSRRPCHGQISAPHSTVPVARSAPRCGQAPGPTCRPPSVPRHATISSPATDVPSGRLRIASLAANAYQLPLGSAL